MMNIRFGITKDTIYHIDRYFNNHFKSEWMDDPLVRAMVRDVDRSEVIKGALIESPVLGAISPRDLSGGVKALILMLFRPEKEYYGTACGDNCGKWMIEISKSRDINLSFTRIFEFTSPEDARISLFDAIIVNSGKRIHSQYEFFKEALQGLEEWREHQYGREI